MTEPAGTKKVNLREMLQKKEASAQSNATDRKEALVKKIIARFWQNCLEQLNDPNHVGPIRPFLATEIEIHLCFMSGAEWKESLLKGAPEDMDTSGIQMDLCSDESDCCVELKSQ